MTTVLDDVTSDSIDGPYVQLRVDDWIRRVSSLYRDLSTALPEGWSSKTATRPMQEPLMCKFNVPEASVPSLRMVHESGITASLIPDGLWIIGTNGRLYLYANGERYFVVDKAESFERPNWQICNMRDRANKEPFTPDWLNRILR